MLDERDQVRERPEEAVVAAELDAIGAMGNRARA